MKIAHCCRTFPKLSETFIHNQITGLIDVGYDIDIYAIQSEDLDHQHPMIEEYDLVDKTTYMERPQNYPKALKSIISGLRTSHQRTFESLSRGKKGINRIVGANTIKDDYDLYHVHFGSFAKHLDFFADFNAPFAVSFYGTDASQKLESNPDIYNPLWPRVDAIIVLSYDMKERLINAGAPEEKIYLNPLCIDLPSFEFDPTPYSDPLKIVSIARMTEKKGLRYAIESISHVSDDLNVEYRIAGDGDLRADLEDLVRRENVEDSVTFLGWREQPEIQELLRESHLFMLPSRTAPSGDREGTPTALLEAQAVGLPIISTYHAGIPEIVEHQRRGLLCPVMNSEALAEAIRRLVDRREEWSAMARRGREYVEAVHTRQAQTERLTDIYSSLRR